MKKSTAGRSLAPRPQQWASGPDPEMRPVFRAFVQCRNQAQWRGETWQLTWEQWREIWKGRWHLRGRSADSLCITRRDCALAWSDHNVIVITRTSHGARKRGIRTSLGEGPSTVVLDDTWAAQS
jgi:hypothetical protein